MSVAESRKSFFEKKNSEDRSGARKYKTELVLIIFRPTTLIKEFAILLRRCSEWRTKVKREFSFSGKK